MIWQTSTHVHLLPLEILEGFMTTADLKFSEDSTTATYVAVTSWLIEVTPQPPKEGRIDYQAFREPPLGSSG